LRSPWSRYGIHFSGASSQAQIALLQKQPTINVIDVTEGKLSSLAEKIRSVKDPNLKVIIIKTR